MGAGFGRAHQRATVLILFPFQSDSRRTDEDSALARLGGATTCPIEMDMELGRFSAAISIQHAIQRSQFYSVLSVLLGNRNFVIAMKASPACATVAAIREAITAELINLSDVLKVSA